MRESKSGRRHRVSNGAGRADAPAVRRCAIYTRKSSEEGLEQSFNSLDAQREACEAYILSQKHAGWIALPTMYDDGGISGGTLDRPALQRLLADITAKRVDTVVVYKVDRLTRSLHDFAKIVDVFDASAVAFVSVTQHFNTTSSMGRLTLNMLLSFAQFEREVTGERIRDKIAASKQRGMWMGGRLPLGYDVADRKLVINDAEAATVRHIFERYTVLGSVSELRDDLRREGICGKARSGQRPGARPLARGALYHLLQNRLYRGEITHKGQAYPGQHDAIIGPELWDRVQAALNEHRVERRRGGDASQPSLLAGLVFDGAGGRMSPSHANKKGTRYRYYVSQSLIKQSRADAPAASCRVPAGDLEAIVETSLCDLLADQPAIYDIARAMFADTVTRKAMLAATAHLGRNLPTLPAGEKIAMFRMLIGGIVIRADAVEITFKGEGLAKIVGPGLETTSALLPVVTRTVSGRLKRTGMEAKLLIDGPVTAREPDRSLVRLLARAHQFHRAMMTSQGTTMRDLASEAGVGPSYFARVVRLAFLCPSITQAILQGRQPAGLTANKLQHVSQLPNAWIDQRQQLQLP